MPHPAHFICSNDCRFVLATRIGKYIVSTVGEYWPDRQVREIHARVHDSKWHAENNHRRGDDYDHAYMKRFGYTEIGIGRKYETLVGSAVKAKRGCCPFTMASYDLDYAGYNTAEDAYKGHMKLCRKFANK